MNRAYEFILKLNDMFSPKLMQLAATYGKTVGTMERKKTAMAGIFSIVSQSVDKLRQKLFGLGSVNSKIRVDSSEIDKASTKATQFLDKMGRLREANGRFSGNGSGGGSGGGFRNMLMGGALSGAMLGGLGGYLGIQGAKEFAGGTIAPAMQRGGDEFMLGLLLKNKQSGKDLSAQLAQFAKDNPVLGSQEVFSSGRKLLSSGFKQNEILPELKMLGDLSAGSGTSIDALTYLYKQIKQNGAAQAQELGPLADYIPVYDELSKLLKRNIQDVKKLGEGGKISFEMVQKALQNLTSGNGLYAGASEGLAQESIGRYQQLLGDLQEKGVSIGKSLLPYVNKALTFFNEVLAKIAPLEKALGVLKNGFISVGRGVMTLLNNFIDFQPGLSNAEKLIMVLSSVVYHLGNALQILGNIIQFLSDKPLLLAIVTFGLLKTAVLSLNWALLANPVGAFTATIWGLGLAFYAAFEKFETFRNAIIDGWEGLKVFFNGLGMAMELIAQKNITGLMALSQVLDEQAEKNGKRAILEYNLKQAGIDSISDRRKGRKSGNGIENPFGLPIGAPTGNSGSLAAAAGLNSTAGNSKSNSITINVKSLIEKSEIVVMNAQEGIDDLESKVIDALLRVVNSGTRAVTA